MPALLSPRQPPRVKPIQPVVATEHALARGLVSYWALPGAAIRDVAGRAPAGSFSGAAGWTASAYGPALNFPGSTSDYASVASYAAMRVSTISVMAFARVTNTAATGVLLNVNYDGSTVPFFLGAGPFIGVANGGCFASFNASWFQADSFVDYRDGAWRVYVGTYDGNNLRFYANRAVTVATTQTGLCATTNTNALDLGAYRTNSLVMSGQMAAAAIWNRALTAAEVAVLAADPFTPIRPLRPARRAWLLDSGLAPQLAAPISDQSTGTWTTAPLYEKLDETVADDADFIIGAPGLSGDKFRVKLTSLTDPSVSTGHILRYRYRKYSGSTGRVDFIIRLIQGASTVIASATHTDISATITAGSLTLSGAEADSITDYTDLYVEGEQQWP